VNDDLYHAAIMTRASAAADDCRLTDADVSATVDNPLCGDRVTLDLRLDGDRIAAIGHRVRGCALCRASVAVIGETGPGATRDQMIDAETAMRALLEAGDVPADRWSVFEIFRPVADHPSRHGCVLLPFEALRNALNSLR
jgi:nitrogen fixation NifU-like protein